MELQQGLAMLRKITVLCLVLAGLAGGSGLTPSAWAQTGCPPGETFIPTLNRCIASGSSTCPPGTHYDADLRRCIGVPQNRCAADENFDPQQNACVPAPK